ncbi:hypothetical protein A9G29_01095 [Gilliamella sp. Fer2-1]|nr:hypothetical protein A9G29_01095 [Gilliamella apicola]
MPVVGSYFGRYRYTACCADSSWFSESFFSRTIESGHDCRGCLHCLVDVFQHVLRSSGSWRRSGSATNHPDLISVF